MGEIVLVHLNKKLTLCEHLSDSDDGKSSLVRRVKKTLKIPSKSIFLKTNIKISSYDQLIEFNLKCSTISNHINLNDIWELLSPTYQTITAEEIGGIYFGKESTLTHIAALMLSIDNDTTYFSYKKNKIQLTSAQDLKSILENQYQSQQKKQTEQKILDFIENEEIEYPLNESESEILNHIRNFATQGREYPRSGYVVSLFNKNNPIKETQLQKQLFQKLVKSGSLTDDYPLEVAKSKIPKKFNKLTLTEVENLNPAYTKHTLDLSNIETYTIDDANTKDKDDAFSLDENTLWIHITDLTNIVKINSALDKEAFNRTSSLYMPDGIIPMLPRGVSEQIGSLNKNELRQCISLKLTTHKNGEIINTSFHRTLIKSDKSISYKEAESILEDKTHSLHKVFTKIQEITKLGRKKRHDSGAFELLNRKDMKIRSSISGEVFIEVLERDSLSNLLISELMITYNCKVAEFLKSHKIPASYKIQKSPDFNELDKIPDSILENFKVGRYLRPALYSRSPGWHFGLGVNAYTQASSPLRRYSDLCIQRQLIQFIDNGNHVYSEDEISSICHSVEAQKKKLSLIEKSRTRYWFLKYLKDTYLSRNKPIMEAVALEDGSDNRTPFELIKYPYRGKCIFNNEIKAGQIVSVKLSGIDLWERSAQFSYVK